MILKSITDSLTVNQALLKLKNMKMNCDFNRFNHFLLNCLRKLLKMAKQDPGFKCHKNTYSSEVGTATWTRKANELSPKKVFYGKLQMGKRSQCGQKKRNREDINIPPESWEEITHEKMWICLIRKGADDYEAKGVCEAERKTAQSQKQRMIVRAINFRMGLFYVKQAF